MSEQGQPEKDWRDSEPFDPKKYKNFFELTRGGVVVLALVVIGVLIFSSDVQGYWQNIYITGIGAVLTVTFLDRQAEQRATRQRKEELILQMGSPNKGFAVEAARLLGQKIWLMDGSLQGAYLAGANLQKADLNHAKLQGAYLAGANLQRARLLRANLQEADFSIGKLQGAHFLRANLQGAKFVSANLQEANLLSANLQGANLLSANLQGANLWDAIFNKETILPDSSHWTLDRDMGEFTNPNHSNFWRSKDKSSPAYRGD